MIRPQDNPFRVDRVTALPFLGNDVAALADRFLELRRAAIVGPHGVGKSTLLRTIGDRLADAGHDVRRVSLPGSATARERRAAIRNRVRAIVLFDGFEQLTWLQRRRVLRWPRVLVTAHAPTRLPTLVTLTPTVATLDAVIQALHPTSDDELRSFAHAAFARHRGDIRATLFDLYDAASGPLSGVLTGEG